MITFIKKSPFETIMIQKNILRQIVNRQKNIKYPISNPIKREIENEVLKYFKDNRIIIITGLRRTGKSTLLRQLMQKQENYCYFNFEEEKISDFRAEDFETLNEILIEIYGESDTYFFDEIQNVPKFELFVRRLQDQGKKIVITGSNASLLSKELGTRLTGRYKAFELFPFSFKEFLTFTKKDFQTEDLYDTKKIVQLKKSFQKYQKTGGLPGFLQLKDHDYVKTLLQNILYRDIITRYKIKKEKTIIDLVILLTSNISTLFSFNSLKKTLGLANAITVKEYISYLSNSYLFFQLEKHEFSLKKQLIAQKKIYLIDPIFKITSGFNFSKNEGRILENLVFLQLKRQKKEIYYHKNKHECDFVTKKGLKITEAIQICHILNEKNMQREINGLLEAMKEHKLKTGTIITFEQEEEIIKENKKINVIPIYKYLLNKK